MLTIAAEGGASAAERLQIRLLRAGNVTGWRTHVWACGYELDVAFVREMVAIEVDGWAWHRDVERFSHDAKRQNALVNAGWHILRFNWHRLTNDPDGVLREIRAALASRS
jgi:very-short-patch-repair endonuclease